MAPADRAEEKGFLAKGGPFLFPAVCALAAALMSALYVAFYLRGGPRIVDATTYFLEGRALSEGHLSWRVDDPSSASMGRFLVRAVADSGEHAAGIFPPGYPAVLALGFLVGAPMLVGPLLAAALVFATASLARQASLALHPERSHQAESVARAAAVFSVLSATLRYHTADTMSHGLAALCVTCGLAAAYRLRRSGARRLFSVELALGISLGWLAATRPVSALAALALVVWIVPRAILRAWSMLLVGAAPGALLFVVHQHAATGAWLGSSQSLYYATADGPAGCFRYGFGEGIGCRVEHGEFVAHNLPHGYGAFAAAATSLRRLKMHLSDALNATPLAAVVVGSMVHAVRLRALRPLGLALGVFVVAYAPFYFDGNYPGGGARFFADVLPAEHVLVALALPAAANWATRRFGESTPSVLRVGTLGGLAALVSFAMLAGFALETRHDHEALRDREGGRPMYERARMAETGVGHGLVFVDTDHGFSLGFDPDARASRTFEVARLRNDDSDRWLWEARGRPPAFRYDYVFHGQAPAEVVITRYEPGETRRLEIESLWPPLAQQGGYATPWFDACASQGRGLSLTPDLDVPPFAIDVRFALPARVAGGTVAPRVALRSGVHATLTILSPRGTLAEWTMVAPTAAGAEPAAAGGCPAPTDPVRLTAIRIPNDQGPLFLDVRVLTDPDASSPRGGGAPIVVDALELEPGDPFPSP